MDWLEKAMKRQQRRRELLDAYKPSKGYVYNERARMWVDADQLDREKNRQAYEENRRKWEAFKRKEAEHEEEQRQIQADIRAKRNAYLTEEEKELSKQIRIERKEPTYEEWKAAREKERQEQAKNKD